VFGWYGQLGRCPNASCTATHTTNVTDNASEAGSNNAGPNNIANITINVDSVAFVSVDVVSDE